MSRRWIAATLALVVLAPAAAGAKEKTWKDHVKSAAGSGLLWAGEQALNQFAAGLYGLKCKDGKPAPNEAPAVVDDLVCSVAGDLSGRSEADWQQSVSRDLEVIKGQLDKVLEGQKDLTDAMNRQSAAMRKAFDDMPTRIGVKSSVRQIQTAWGLFNDFYAKVGAGTKTSEVQQLQKEVAQKLLDSYKVDDHARALRTVIIDGADNEPPLPMLLVREIDQWNRARLPEAAWSYQDPRCKKGGPYPCVDLLRDYEGLEIAMQTWLLRQKQAQVMNLWVRQTLGTGIGLAELELESHERDLEAQLESFEHAVEWLVLASSAPRSPFANFLAEGSNEAFARVDALKGLHLSSRVDPGKAAEGRAVWGRVISMGESFSGELGLGIPGKGQTSLAARQIDGKSFREYGVQGFEGELDWWTASDPASPAAYDTPHFAKAWRIYRFKYPLGANGPLGDYGLTSKQHLPYLPATVPVDSKVLGDLVGHEIPFGSFVGIARAGGGYALFSGELVPDDLSQWGGASEVRDAVAVTAQFSDVSQRGSMPRVAIGEKASTNVVQQHTQQGRKARSFDVDRRVVVRRVSRKKVRTANGQPGGFDLHVLWNEDDLGAGSLGEVGNRGVVMINDWSSFEMAWGTEAEYKVTAGVVLGYLGQNPGNGVSLTKAGTNDEARTEFIAREAGAHDCKRASTFPPKFLPVSVGAEIHLKLPAVAKKRSWTMLAKTSVQTAYLTRAGGPSPCP